LYEQEKVSSRFEVSMDLRMWGKRIRRKRRMGMIYGEKEKLG